MIDLHSHILYTIEGDDGSRSQEMSLDMLRMAVEAGTTDIFATPHVNRRGIVPHWEDIVTRTEELREAAVQANIPIRVHTGAEVELNYTTLDFLGKGETRYCLNGSHYILTELTPQSDPEQTESLLYELMLREYIPVLAHPERYDLIMTHPERILKWMQKGVLTQCNAGSFIGQFGEQAKERAELLYRHQMICFLGSDAHRTDWRNPDTSAAEEGIRKFTGSAAFWDSCCRNADNIVRHKLFYPTVPDCFKKQKKGFFSRLFG